MTRFDPPGFLDDLSEAHKDQWSATVSAWLDEAAAGRPAQNDGPRRQFFNALTAPPSDPTQVAPIAWNAFPRQIRATSMSERQRWRRADSDRDVQDEYCEWSVTRSAGKIVRVTFTSEPPEYWNALALLNPDKVVELYQTFISPSVRKADLFPNGTYNPRNRFNRGTSEGAMHLIQPANTLTAEIELAAAATIRRERNGAEITDAQELIHCSRYGEPGRNSDPFIGEQVNALTRQRADITLNNPIGLYIAAFTPTGEWKRRDTGETVNASDFWKFVRGRDDHFVRAVFEVPPERGFFVGDLTIDGRPVEFGAQITDFVTIKLEGLAARIGASTVTPVQGCRGAQPPAMVPAPPGAILALVGAGRTGRVSASADPGQLAATPPAVTGLTADEAAERALLERLPESLRRDSEIEVPADGAAPPALLPYPKLPASKLKARNVTGKLLAYASPDSTFAVTKRLLDSAQESIVIGIYDFHADHVKATLKAAMQRGVSVSLMLDTNSADEADVFEELTDLGAECVRAPSSSAGNPIKFFNNAHEKIIVVDRQVVMIQSGNWSDNSIPFNEGDGVVLASFMTGNRDMGLAVHSPELAAFFADLVARDMRLAQGLPPDALPPSAVVAGTASPAAEIFFEAAPPAIPVTLFKSLTVTPDAPVRVTPVITPENFHPAALEFLSSATTSLRIEQQYIRGGQPAIEELLEAIDAARTANPDITIQIIVSPKFLTGDNRTNFLDAMDRFGFEFDQHWRFLSARHFVHCHNKLIVVDDEKVLLGSQNWSTTGVKTNREASLLVEHSGVAAYFGEVFDADWRMSEPAPAPPGTVLGIGPETIVDAREFARGGVVISSVRDYQDV